MVKNTYVTITACPELARLRLAPLEGRRGIVVEDLSDHRTAGGMVLLEEAFMDEFLWFIPDAAVRYD